MRPPLHPTVFGHLQAVQRSTRVGLHGLLRRKDVGVRSASTLYRWQRSLGDQLLVVPNVSVEALGLRHAHVFLTNPLGDVDCPFAVEAAWVTMDFCQEVLYLHCLVPLGQVSAFTASMAGGTITWSGSGWQQLLTTNEEVLLPVEPDAVETDLIARYPFIIPAMTELWQYPNSLPLVWHRIHQRLGSRVKEYLPRTKIRYVNGKNHITETFNLLQREGLVRQQLIRYHPLLAVSVEVFLMIRLERADVQRLLEALRGVLHAVESYPTTDGYWCRLLGPHRLLDAIINLPASIRSHLRLVFFHTKRHPTPMVRFAYETVFDSKTKTWVTA
jgi:hypothetical protein